MRQGLIILATHQPPGLAGRRPPALAGLHPTLDLQNIGGWSMALEALSFAGYYMYKNSPAQRAKGYEENWGRESGTSPAIWAFLTCLPRTGHCFQTGTTHCKGAPPRISFINPGCREA